MATFNISKQQVDSPYGDRARVTKWEGLTEAATRGEPLVLPSFTDRSFQVGGDFGTSGEVVLEGVLYPDAVDDDYQTLHDPQGNEISITSGSSKIVSVQENVYAMRPRVIAGTSVDLNCHLLSR